MFGKLAIQKNCRAKGSFQLKNAEKLAEIGSIIFKFELFFRLKIFYWYFFLFSVILSGFGALFDMAGFLTYILLGGDLPSCFIT